MSTTHDAPVVSSAYPVLPPYRHPSTQPSARIAISQAGMASKRKPLKVAMSCRVANLYSLGRGSAIDRNANLVWLPMRVGIEGVLKGDCFCLTVDG